LLLQTMNWKKITKCTWLFPIIKFEFQWDSSCYATEEALTFQSRLFVIFPSPSTSFAK
jgi:hypothetical protein